ncbi:hypothetical protein [Actinopolymorpha rutila]|uniref:Uncharacterized protein n=1 Tax=Actinopolymorpha rutila TaxID=446787 RepID=A0A852Z3U9_9ACTN|nr:hypothetical protein [Actinopolymorpha rutila]NYH87654.1 hypothetical protein [Actinopolymorpha rutila]
MGRKKTADRRLTFAEVVEAVVAADPGPHAEWIPFRSALEDGEYTDERGVQWHLRRGELKVSRVEHLMRDPHVRVLHCQGSDVRDVPMGEREALLVTIRPYLKGVKRPSPGDYTDYFLGEFKDDNHRSLLIIEEQC